jgi:hypothetical protein
VAEEAGQQTDDTGGETAEPAGGDATGEPTDHADEAGDSAEQGEDGDDSASSPADDAEEEQPATGDGSSDDGSSVEDGDAQDPADDSDPRNDRCLRPREAISTSQRPWWTLGRCWQNAQGHWLWLWLVDWLEHRRWDDDER